jgi:hypothetical protein
MKGCSEGWGLVLKGEAPKTPIRASSFGDYCPVLKDLAERGADEIMKELPKHWFWSDTLIRA